MHVQGRGGESYGLRLGACAPVRSGATLHVSESEHRMAWPWIMERLFFASRHAAREVYDYESDMCELLCLHRKNVHTQLNGSVRLKTAEKPATTTILREKFMTNAARPCS